MTGGPPADRLSRSGDWPAATLLAAKRRTGLSVAVVIPARNEAATVAGVVAQIAGALLPGAGGGAERGPDAGVGWAPGSGVGLVDELIVMDSLSTDDTAAVAAAAGADVHSVATVRADLGVQAGKGEALWKSQFVTAADLLVFVDADLLDWGVHFVTGLLGPLLTDPRVLLVKGFYDRVFDDDPLPDAARAGDIRPQGGRVTELVARPLLSLRWPELTGIVQPLAGEWSIRRSLMRTLPIPSGYGIELATLLDTHRLHGDAAIAQVDLGRRAHRHQTIHDLGVMAAEIIAVADRRSGLHYADGLVETTLSQYDRAADPPWVRRLVPLGERPPADLSAALGPSAETPQT